MARVLLVDDNPASLRYARDALSTDGQTLLCASTGAEGLALAREALPDLVVLDLGLPDMDGLTVIREIRNDPRTAGLRVLALTAHAMAGDRDRAIAARFDAYVSKPIRVAELRALVRRMLAGLE